MNHAQLRRAIREMMKGQTTSNPTPLLNTGDNFAAFKFMFNADALEVFKNQTTHLIHQYNEPNNDLHVLYGLFELAALLGIKSADNNPCAQMFTRKTARVRFFGFSCDIQNVNKAREKLIHIINDMASSKWLIASLYNLGTLELASDPLNPSSKRVCVFSYLAVRPEFDAAVDMTYSFAEFKEGGIPPEWK